MSNLNIGVIIGSLRKASFNRQWRMRWSGCCRRTTRRR